MSVAFTNANIFFGGYEVTAQHNQVALEFSAESLDETAFGADTRKMRGGLKVARMTSAGFFKAGVGEVDQIWYDSHALADAVILLFPEAIAVGATSTGSGYMMKATLLQYQTGGTVGDILPCSIPAEGRGAGL